MCPRHLQLTVVAALALIAPAARASPGFPSEIRSHLGGSATPQCTVCHTTNVGGIGTITKDFGTALVDRGLVLEDNASLDDALDALDADAVDSDGDGVTDVDEVKTGSDPNVADSGDGGPVQSLEPISYGFGCSGVSQAQAADAAGLAIVVTGAALGAAVRRRSRRRA